MIKKRMMKNKEITPIRMKAIIFDLIEKYGFEKIKTTVDSIFEYAKELGLDKK